jgi:hypothetical protein
MIKKYIMIISAILVMLMFTSTSSASVLFSKISIYERIQEKSIFKKALEKITKTVAQKGSIVQVDSDENDEDLEDADAPNQDVLLPETIDVVGEVTPDNGNEPVIEEDELEDTPTIDVDGEEGVTLNDEITVDTNGEVGTTGVTTVDQDGTEGITLKRIIEIFTEKNGMSGTVLQKVVERTFAPGTTESDGVAENVVDTVVVVEGSAGVSASSYTSNNVVVSDND